MTGAPVEFVDEPSEGPDDELPLDELPPRRPFGRSWAGAAAVAAVLLAGGLLAAAATSRPPTVAGTGRTRPGTAAVIRLPAVATVWTERPLVVERVAGRLVAVAPTEEDPASRCPPRLLCARLRRTTGGTLRTVRHLFPGAVIVDQHSVVVTDGEHQPFLWYRVITCVEPTGTILVRLQQPTRPRLDGEGSRVVDGVAVSFVRLTANNLTVTAQLIGEPETDGMATLRRLAEAPGLAALA